MPDPISPTTSFHALSSTDPIIQTIRGPQGDPGPQGPPGDVTADGTFTFTNKTIDFGGNVLTGTKAQFDVACSDGNFVFYNGSGNVGIGTVSPSTKLHVYGGSIFNQSASGTPYFIFGNADGGPNLKYSYIGGGSGGYITFGKASDALAPSAEWARFDGSGNIGIGTTSPWVAAGYVSVAINGSSSGSVLDLRQADSMKLRLVATSSSATIETASSIPLVISPAGVEKLRLDTDGSLTSARGLTVNTNTNGTVASPAEMPLVRGQYGPTTASFAGIYMLNEFTDNSSHYLSFKTTTAANVTAERARFNAAGDLIVGSTTSRGRLTVEASSGSCRAVNVLTGTSVIDAFTFNGAAVGSISTNGSTVAYNTSSDVRLKSNITDASPSGDLIDTIRVVSYDWKAGGDVRYGVVAQELNDVFPEAVSAGDTSDTIEHAWGVDLSKLVPLLIKEVQTLRQRVAYLEGAIL